MIPVNSVIFGDDMLNQCRFYIKINLLILILIKHIITKDHRVDWDHSKILTFEIDFTKRRFLKSFFIHNSENSINDKENCFYSEIYNNLTLSTVVYYSPLNFLFCLFLSIA